MDRLRRKRPVLSDHAGPAAGLSRLETDMAWSPATASPASSLEGSKSDLFQSIVPRALRSMSRVSSPRSSHSSSTVFSRNVLQKTQSRRSSAGSDGFGRISRASTTLSGGSSVNSVDWKSQPVETHAPLEADLQLLRTKPPGYLVVTTDYIIILKCKADALAAFPQLASEHTKKGPANPEPVQVIPIHLIVAVFHAESCRPSFGVEVWWRSPYPTIAFAHAQLFFNLPTERRDQMRSILEMVRNKNREFPDGSRVAFEVEECCLRICRTEEPHYPLSKPEIFPVIRRGASTRDPSSRAVDGLPKKAADGTSFYLVIGVNLCFLVEVAKASIVQEAPLKVDYQSFGLVTLESFRGEWLPHEERFVLRFRDPLKQPTSLELASRYYKQIMLTLMKADKYLKPAWPTQWQIREIFHVSRLPEPQHVVEGEDFGGLHRTLAAFCAAYRCKPVEWEINWKTPLAPEFRIIPPKNRETAYSALQMLAVLRALRYNDFFVSLCFRDVKLSSLWGRYDSQQSSSIAYMNRSCICLNDVECSIVQRASLLYQEFHALCFASEAIRQIDFTNCLRSHPTQPHETGDSIQFLKPILDLLRAGLTRCNRIILRGCALGPTDVEHLVDSLNPSLVGTGSRRSGEPISLEVLDISGCGLSDVPLRSLFRSLPNTGPSLQVLDVSKNCGRVPVTTVASFAETLFDMKRLNLSSCLMGDLEGPLISLETLCYLEKLEELNLSNFKLNEASQRAVDGFLDHLSTRYSASSEACALRSLNLNNCGLTGYGAGRMFHAMTGLHGIDFHMSSNPLELGIDRLIQAIGLCWRGNYDLHMDMIEFRDESNYIRLIRALTVSKHIRFLSLVGTAPTPTEEATCSPETCDALEHFFANNKSIRFLDMSGFHGKLDEGQLGNGVGRSLRGLARNKTLTHFRMRNQNLHEDMGILGAALYENSTIRLLDCGDNNLNLTSLRYMVKSLERNTGVVEFPLSSDERGHILERCLRDLPRTKAKKKGVTDSVAEARRDMLRSEIEKSFAELQAYLARNRTAIEVQTGQVMDLGESEELGKGWPSLELKLPEGATPTDAAQAAGALERSTVRSCSVPPEAVIQTPYHVLHDDELLDSPESPGSPRSDMPTTPELEDVYSSSSAGEGGVGGARIDVGGYTEYPQGGIKLSSSESELGIDGVSCVH